MLSTNRSLYELGQSFGLAPPSHGYTVAEKAPEVVTAPGIYFPATQGEVLTPEHYLQKKQQWGTRGDGTPKGSGFLGVHKGPNGEDKTEHSIGVNFDGKDMEIPTMVPTLSREELNHILSGGQITPEISKKAIDHAKERMGNGLSPFYQEGEERVPPFSRQNEGPVIPDENRFGLNRQFALNNVTDPGPTDLTENRFGLNRQFSAPKVETFNFADAGKAWVDQTGNDSQGPSAAFDLSHLNSNASNLTPAPLSSFGAAPSEPESLATRSESENFRDRMTMESTLASSADKEAASNRLLGQGSSEWGNPMSSVSQILTQKANEIEKKRKVNEALLAPPPVALPSMSLSSFSPATQVIPRANEGPVTSSQPIADVGHGEIMKSALKGINDIIKAITPKNEVPLIPKADEGKVKPPNFFDKMEEAAGISTPKAQAQPADISKMAPINTSKPFIPPPYTGPRPWRKLELTPRKDEGPVKPEDELLKEFESALAAGHRPTDVGEAFFEINKPVTDFDLTKPVESFTPNENSLSYQAPESSKNRLSLNTTTLPKVDLNAAPPVGSLQIEGGPKIDVTEKSLASEAPIVPGSTGGLNQPITGDTVAAYQKLTAPPQTPEDVAMGRMAETLEPEYTEKSLAKARETNPNALATFSPFEKTYYDAHPLEKLKDDAVVRAQTFLAPYQKAYDEAAKTVNNMAQGFGTISGSHKAAKESLAAAAGTLAKAEQVVSDMYGKELESEAKVASADTRGRRGMKYTPFGYGQMIDENGTVYNVPVKSEIAKDSKYGAPHPRTDKGWTLVSDPTTGQTMAIDANGTREPYDANKHGVQEAIGVIGDEDAIGYAKQIAEGTLMPIQLRQVIQAYGAAGSQSKNKIFKHLRQIDPNFNFKVADAVYSADINSLKTLTNIYNSQQVAMNTAIKHGNEIKKLARIADVGSIPALNRYFNAGRKQILGDKTVNDLDVALHAFDTEFARYLTTMTPGGVVAQREIGEARKLLSSAQTPEMLISAINEIQKLMDDKKSSFEDQINHVKVSLGMPLGHNRHEERPSLDTFLNKNGGTQTMYKVVNGKKKTFQIPIDQVETAKNEYGYSEE